MLLKKDNPYDERAVDFLKGTGQRYYCRSGIDRTPFHYIAPYHVWYKSTPEGFDGQWPEELPAELHQETIEYFERMLKWYKEHPPKFSIHPNFNEPGYRTPTKEELSIGMECELREMIDWGAMKMGWVVKPLDEEKYNRFMEWDGRSIRDCKGLPLEGWIRIPETDEFINSAVEEWNRIDMKNTGGLFQAKRIDNV